MQTSRVVHSFTTLKKTINMSSTQQYMRELPSHSSQEHSASKNYKQNLQPLQTTGKGLNNHWIFSLAAASLLV